MGLEKRYFWSSLRTFSSNSALVDTAKDGSVTYSELEQESQALAEKLKISIKGMIFLFTNNNSKSVITYIASLKSNNAVLLLDEKLNDEIRSGLIENYKPDFFVLSGENILKLNKTRKYNYNMK